MPNPVFRLPPYRVESVYTALAETVDWGLAVNGVPALWAQTQGAGVRVAVLDTGAQPDHPDLQGAIVDSRDFTGSIYGVADRQGHSSHCCGIIAARKNDTGVVGVAPLAELLVGKVLGDDGSGSDLAIARGIQWAIERKADIISMSLGSPQESPAISMAVRQAVSAGRFVICAAGNEGRDNSVNYPGRMAEVVGVGAVDRQGRVAAFSSRGPEVDIAAPGQDVTSCFLDGGYARLSGTSMACPFVAGVVALVLAKHKASGGQTPITNNSELLEHLHRTAKDAGPEGRDPAYGWGLIDPASMLASAIPSPPPGPPPVVPPGGGGGLELALGPFKLHIPARVGDWAGVDVDLATRAAVLAALKT